MDVGALVQSLVQNDAFARLINDPLAQFGPVDQPFLGADIMPERVVLENEYTEEGIRYRSPVANHGTRYSPVQIKEGMIVGSMRVTLGNSDIGAELTGQQYDHIIRLLQRAYGVPGLPAASGGGVSIPSMQAIAAMLRWTDLGLVRPLHARNEVDRWAAIVDAQVVMSGDNGFIETVTYPNPAGHRVNAGGTWSSNSYDPWPDIIAQAEFMRSKGYTIGRMIVPSQVLTILVNNQLMRQRAGYISVVSGIVTGLAGRLTREDLNSLAERDSLPPFELYDQQYFTQNAGATSVTSLGYTLTGNWFLKRNVMVMLARTGRDEEIDRGDLEPVVRQDTLGYVGVGRPAGQSTAGMVVEVEAKRGKPPRIEGQAWQTSLPVITEPEAICVIKNIA
jgi:hypothetical protein